MAKGDSQGGRPWSGMPTSLQQPQATGFGPSQDILSKLFAQSNGNPFQNGTSFQPSGILGGMAGNTLQGAQAFQRPGLQYPTQMPTQMPTGKMLTGSYMNGTQDPNDNSWFGQMYRQGKIQTLF